MKWNKIKSNYNKWIRYFYLFKPMIEGRFLYEFLVPKDVLDLVRNIKLDKNYPMIKCNINRKGKRLFFFPFDKLYDNVHIDIKNGEFYTNNIKECIQILSYCLSKISVNKKILEKSNYENIFSVELINEMVLKGMPFRDAYLELKSKLKSREIKFPKTVNHSHIGSIGNLALDKIVLKMKDNY